MCDFRWSICRFLRLDPKLLTMTTVHSTLNTFERHLSMTKIYAESHRLSCTRTRYSCVCVCVHTRVQLEYSTGLIPIKRSTEPRGFGTFPSNANIGPHHEYCY